MADRAGWRIQVLTKHLSQSVPAFSLEASVCLAYETPEANSGNSAILGSSHSWNGELDRYYRGSS